MKKISIIIPCYNVEAYIDRCMESLLGQTIGIEQMELIFVNDASTDGTFRRLTEIEQTYPESVIVVNFEKNQRQGAARNAGLLYASAEYVGYVDADDTIEPCMFEKMLSVIEQYDCDFVQCRWDCIDAAGNKSMTKPWKKPGLVNLQDALQRKEFICFAGRLVSLCDKVYKRSFLLENDIYCPEGVRFEDTFFGHLVFVNADSVYCMDDVFYHYYTNPEGTMQGKKQGYQEDVICVAAAFLQVCTERGLRERQTEAVEWLFLENIYVYLLWEIMQEYPEQAYAYYCRLKAIILECGVEYRNNSYAEAEGNEFDRFMLKLLDYDFTQEQFEGVRRDMVTKIHMHN